MKKSTKHLLMAAGAIGAAVVVYKVVQAKKAVAAQGGNYPQAQIAQAQMNRGMGNIAQPPRSAQQGTEEATDDTFDVVSEWAYDDQNLTNGWK